MYISSFSKTGGKAFAEYEEIMEFARRAMALLGERCNSAIVHGNLNRVDVMWTQASGLVVNEFESMEACYDGTWEADSNETRMRMKAYWYSKLIEILKVP